MTSNGTIGVLSVAGTKRLDQPMVTAAAQAAQRTFRGPCTKVFEVHLHGHLKASRAMGQRELVVRIGVRRTHPHRRQR